MAQYKTSQEKYSSEDTVTTYHTGPDARASLTALCNFFRETAWQHANHAKLGYYDLKEYGYLWILSRLRIKIHRYPEWNERIRVLTWPKFVERLFAFRDFIHLDLNNHVNNVKYIEWIINEHPEEILKKYRISDFRIDFPGEAKTGDIINLEISPSIEKEERKTFNVILKKDSPSRNICRARAKWTPGKS